MKKIIPISLALVLLVANLGFTLGTHFCCGEAVKSSLMIGHSHMPEMEQECPGKGIHLEAKACCEDKYQPLQIEDDYRSGMIQTFHADFVIAFVQLFSYLNFVEQTDQSYSTYHRPLLPLFDKDIIILVQSFLL